MKKVLYFEGAGWSEAEGCNDVGNCRIRTAFTNKNGKRVYLEMFRGNRNKQMPRNIPESYIFVDFAHFITDNPDRDDCNASRLPVERNADTFALAWTRKNILKIVNDYCGGDFDAVEVLNDLTGYCVFTGEHTRTSADYNFGDVFEYDAERTEKALEKRRELQAENCDRFGMKYDNASYYIDGNALVMRLYVSDEALARVGAEREQRFSLDA